VAPDALFAKSVFLSRLLQKEEVQENYITSTNKAFFNHLLELMISRRIVVTLPAGTIALRTGAETFVLFASSLIWPMIDSYYSTLLYTVSMAIDRNSTGASTSVEATQIIKRVQWLSESLYDEKVIKYYEACNIESIKNAIATFKELGVLVQKSVFIMLSDSYRSDETLLTGLLEQINDYRCSTNVEEALSSILQADGKVKNSQSLRRSLMIEFPFMAKL